MAFLKTFLIPMLVLLALSFQVRGHALITPALSVKGKGVINDVQRPSGNNPCGNVDIAKNLDSSTPANTAADGSFTLTVTSFNGGNDGSRQVSMKVDADGSGKNFVNAKVTKNGDNNPADASSQQVTASLPPGTKCTGGKTKDLCLASVVTTVGFGNCVVIKQGRGGGNEEAKKNATPRAIAVDDFTGSKDTVEIQLNSRDPEADGGLGCNENQQKRAVVGTRAPRYIRRQAGLSSSIQ